MRRRREAQVRRMTDKTSGLLALALCLALALGACSGGDQGTPEAATRPSGDASLEEGVETPPEAFQLGPNTYEMLTLGDKDAAAVAREYLNSGYTAAACQLVLFGDGGGLLYDGRRMRGVTYDDDSLSVEGEPAELVPDTGSFAVTVGSDTYTFSSAGTPSEDRLVREALVGTYEQRDEEGTLTVTLELSADGTGTLVAGKKGKPSEVRWGTDRVFDRDYLVIDGRLCKLAIQRNAEGKGKGYVLSFDDGELRRLFPAG